MHRFHPALSIALLFTACTAPRPAEPPTAVAVLPTSAPGPERPVDAVMPPIEGDQAPGPSPVAEGSVQPAAAPSPSAAEPSLATATSTPGGQVPGDQPTPTPAAVADAPPGPGALVNPYDPAAGQRAQAQVNPYGAVPTVGGVSAETRAVAAPFLQSVLRRDLAAARGYFAPDARPDDWAAIIPGEVAGGAASDFSGCLGSDPAVSDVPESANRYAITFRFPTDCAVVPSPSGAAQRFNALGVRLERSDNRWWVTGLGAFRAAG